MVSTNTGMVNNIWAFEEEDQAFESRSLSFFNPKIFYALAEIYRLKMVA